MFINIDKGTKSPVRMHQKLQSAYFVNKNGYTKMFQGPQNGWNVQQQNLWKCIRKHISKVRHYETTL